MTDGGGRLVFLPAQGRGYSPGSTPSAASPRIRAGPTTSCDGPSRDRQARRPVLGRTPRGSRRRPPNYAPAIATGLVTAYDAARSALVGAGMLEAGRSSFAARTSCRSSRGSSISSGSARRFRARTGSAARTTGRPMGCPASSPTPRAERRFPAKGVRRGSGTRRSGRSRPRYPELYGDASLSRRRVTDSGTPSPRCSTANSRRGRRVTSPRTAVAPALAAPLDALPLQLRPETLDRAALESVPRRRVPPGDRGAVDASRGNDVAEPFRLKVRSDQLRARGLRRDADPAQRYSRPTARSRRRPGRLDRNGWGCRGTPTARAAARAISGASRPCCRRSGPRGSRPRCCQQADYGS